MTKTIQIQLLSYKETDKDKEERWQGINFVFYSPEENKWYNNNNQNYQINFQVNNILNFGTNDNDVTDTDIDIKSIIIHCETQEISMSIMHRYNICYDIITSLHHSNSNSNHEKGNHCNNSQSYLWVWVWLEFAYQKKLDWQRNYNSRPKEIASSMNRLVNELTVRYINDHINERYSNQIFHSHNFIIKRILSQIGKGEEDGSSIRTILLNLFHKSDIKLTKDRFYSQWYQKLQNNNSYEDVVICQAVVNYLQSGKIDDYWNTLHKGGITNSRLASYERPITSEPRYKPQYLNDLKQILFLLKSIYSLHDISFLYENVKKAFGSIQIIEEIIHSSFKPNLIFPLVEQLGKIVHCRTIISRLIKNNIYSLNKVRDLIYLDNSIEPFFMQLLSHYNYDMNVYDHIEKITLLIDLISCSFPKYSTLLYATNAWMIVTSKIRKSNYTTLSQMLLLRLYKTCTILSRLLSEISSAFINDIAKKAFIINNCTINCDYFLDYSTKLLNQSVFYHLSFSINQLESYIRKQMNIKDWVILNRRSYSKGRLKLIDNLKDVRWQNNAEEIIIITKSIEGIEEIPSCCSGIILCNITNDHYPHPYSNIILNAKKKNVLLCICFQNEHIEDILKYEEQKVELRIILNNPKCSLIRQPSKRIANSKFNNSVIKAEIDTSFVLSKETCNNHRNSLVTGTNDVNLIKNVDSYSLMYYYLSLKSNHIVKQLLFYRCNLLAHSSSSSCTQSDIILNKCKVLIKEIDIPFDDSRTQNIIKKLIDFGMNDNDIAESMNFIKNNWADSISLKILKSLTERKRNR